MKEICRLSTHVLVGILVAMLGIGPEFAWAQEKTPSVTQGAGPSQEAGQNTPEDLPNSPGSLIAQANVPRPPQNGQSQVSAEHPSGTAAAEIGTAAGNPASKPAGIAMAPAKQRQSRSLLIKVGALLGVGAAVGTVFALSKASPSRPPGSQ